MVSSNKLDNVVNNREELASKCMPNVYVNGLTIIVPSDINTFSVIAFNNEPTYQGLIGYMSKLIFKNVTFLKENPNGTLSLFDSNYSITLANTLTKDVPAIMNDVNIHSQL